jgi:hypothetical protein
MRTLLSYLSVLVVIVVISSCGSNRSTSTTTNDSNTVSNDTVRIANDSLKYEIIIIEPGFNSWLVTQPPKGYRSKSSMDISNDFAVTTYNLRANNPLQYNVNLYPLRIDYDRDVDYGYEVTFLLFNYFKFFEQRYNQRL